MRSQKALNNDIYLMYVYSEMYRQKHNLSIDDFIKVNKEKHIVETINRLSMDLDYLPRDEGYELLEANL